MKHTLLSAVALVGAMWASTSAFAQWAEPALPILNEVNATAIEAGHTYYIKNVGAGQFITGSNEWSTRVSLTRNGINDTYSPALAIYVADSTGTIGGRQVSGVTLRLNGTYTVNGYNGARTFTNTYLFRDEEDVTYIDHGSQDRGYIWNITKGENGYFRIQTADGDPAYPNAYFQYAGWDDSEGEIVYDEEWDELVSGSTVVRFTLEEDTEGCHIDWMFIPADEFFAQKDVYEMRVKLYETYIETMDQAEAENLNVDVSAAEAIYNNPDATIEDLERAIGDLKYQMNAALFQKLFEGASEDDPLEVTDYCLENADFSQGNINGWLCTFQSGVNATNTGYQSATYKNNGTTLTDAGSTVDDDGEPSYVSQFIEAWRENSAPWVLGDAELSQTIYGLPSGIYKLSCDVIAVHQYGKYENPVTGARLFIATDTGTEVYQEVATNDWNPEHFIITFHCPVGVKGLTFGLKTQNTTANWIAADNFRIYYYGAGGGEIPELFMLKDQISKAEESEINESDYANKEILAAFIKALENAYAITAKAKPTAEECQEATEALKAALGDAQQSIKDYVTFKKYIDEASGLTLQLLEAGFQEAATAVDQLAEEWEKQYEEGTATKEMIDALDGVAYKTMKEKVFGDITPGTTLTFLIENPHFTRGGGKDLTAKDAIPGWTINSGIIGDLRAAAHNIETWHASFDLSQTLTDMPAGVYDITLQGFVSHDDGGPTDLTWFYGGMSTAFLIDQLEDDTQKSTVPFYDSSKPSLGDDHYDFQNGTDEDGNPLYVCGGMTSAYYWFQEINPNTGEPYYTNHIKVLHEKEGDLTIGIHCESTHDWVIWDNFTLTYVGQDNNVIADQLLKSLEELEEAASDDRSFLTAKANELTETLPEEAQKAISDNDADAMLTKIKEVNEAIQYIQEGHDLLEELLNTVAIYNESINNFDGLTPTDDSYADLLAKWDIDGGGKGRPSELADNQALHDLINQLKNGWVPYVMSAATNATQENPVNVTPVIVQPTYMDPLTGEFNENGWTSTIGTPGWDNYPEIEFYDKNFDHRQTIQNLPQGWYRVTINGFYRAGFADAAAKAYVADTMAYNAVMFAIGIDSVATHLTDIFADAQEVPFHGSDEVTVTLADDNSWYVPNRMASAYTYFDAGMYQNEVWAQVGEDGQLTIGVSKNQYISGDWTIFTNWNLWYAGKEPFDPTTGIHEMVNGQMVNGKWSNGKCYNLAGQQLSAKRTIDLSPSTHDLKKGIYLINGRKMVVK